MIRVYINENQVYSKPIEYMLHILKTNKKQTLEILKEKENAELIFDHTDSLSVPINNSFYDDLINSKKFSFSWYFKNQPIIYSQNSEKPDWLASAFYLINSFQEYSTDLNAESFDRFGRFKYENSFQNEFSCIEKNLVQEYLNEFCKEYLKKHNLETIKRPSSVFVSHDIDTMYGSFLEDGLWAIKRGRIDIVLKLIMNEMLMNPHWSNIDKVIKIDSDYDIIGTFFWIATKKTSVNGVKNADYSVAKEKRFINLSKYNGLHKSSLSTTIEHELKELPFDTKLNRYHFLKITLPSSFEELEKSNIKLDASLGFAEHIGFRNSYGLPYSPFNISTQEPYSFVEIPLNVMDGTLHRYMKIPVKETAARVIDFFERNSNDAVISLLWHNTYFTKYKYSGYLNEYKKILSYLYDKQIKAITPEEILNEFGNE